MDPKPLRYLRLAVELLSLPAISKILHKPDIMIIPMLVRPHGPVLVSGLASEEVLRAQARVSITAECGDLTWALKVDAAMAE